MELSNELLGVLVGGGLTGVGGLLSAVVIGRMSARESRERLDAQAEENTRAMAERTRGAWRQERLDRHALLVASVRKTLRACSPSSAIRVDERMAEQVQTLAAELELISSDEAAQAAARVSAATAQTVEAALRVLAVERSDRGRREATERQYVAADGEAWSALTVYVAAAKEDLGVVGPLD